MVSVVLMVRSTLPLWLVLVLQAAAAGQGPPTAPPAKADKATMIIKVPPDAVLSIGGHPTRQAGPERLFESPLLPPGQSFTYTLTAAWSDSGKPRTESRQVIVKAGDRIVVDFNTPEAVAGNRPTKTRTFHFTYETELTAVPEGKVARIWLPVPCSNEEQDVRIVRTAMPERAKNRVTSEPQYGNQIFYVEAKPNPKGAVPVSVTYRVTRKEVRGESGPSDNGIKLARYLQADAHVPVGGPAMDWIRGKVLPTDQMALVRVIYDTVNGSMRYGKDGIGWGNGDVVWACENRYGNCTDFHSVFIALVRAQKIPAKFEIGFPLPEKRGSGEVTGYHCWAKFRPEGKGWVPVDVSEANQHVALRDYCFGNLSENRVLFSTGRDIELMPRQSGAPLNFFIYPYAEVDGQPHPASRVMRKFTYEDVTDPAR